VSAQNYVAQADELIKGDLSEASVAVQSLAATYKSRQDDPKAHVYARALIRRAQATGYEVPSASAKLTKGELQAEIDRRNAGRAEDSLIVPTGSGRNGSVTRDDLEAALKADDEA